MLGIIMAIISGHISALLSWPSVAYEMHILISSHAVGTSVLRYWCVTFDVLVKCAKWGLTCFYTNLFVKVSVEHFSIPAQYVAK